MGDVTLRGVTRPYDARRLGDRPPAQRRRPARAMPASAPTAAIKRSQFGMTKYRRRGGRQRRHRDPHRGLALSLLVAGVGYDRVAKTLHWITAVLVLGMIGVGLWMIGLPLGFVKLYAYAWHKWIGLVVLLLTMVRLLWRRRHPPPRFPLRFRPGNAAWRRSPLASCSSCCSPCR